MPPTSSNNHVHNPGLMYQMAALDLCPNEIFYYLFTIPTFLDHFYLLFFIIRWWHIVSDVYGGKTPNYSPLTSTAQAGRMKKGWMSPAGYGLSSPGSATTGLELFGQSITKILNPEPARIPTLAEKLKQKGSSQPETETIGLKSSSCVKIAETPL